MPGDRATRRAPLADLRDEGLAILQAAAARGLTLRATGGIGVALRCPSSALSPLRREYKDIDLVGVGKERKQLDALLRELGYAGDEEFNLLHGSSRLLYWDRANGRQLDVFLDRVIMCHALDLGERLPLDELTLPPADLLLTKLQVVETNERDLQDAVALLVDCEVDGERVASVLAADWGWWRTATEVLGKVEGYGASVLASEQAALLRGRISALRERIDAEPKSLRWRARAKVGERVRWYELPEEGAAK